MICSIDPQQVEYGPTDRPGVGASRHADRHAINTLNKHATVEQNLCAMRTLRGVGVEFDMGFMLLDPGTTFASLRENIAFLRKVAELGGPPISFVKMLPLAGTAIERRLVEEGRIGGDPVRPDYRYMDRRLDYYALWITVRFTKRNSSSNGLVETLRKAYFDHLVARAFENAPWTAEYGHEIRAQSILRTTVG